MLKTFWSATFMGVPAVLLRSDQFNGWTSCFLELIRRPVPQACLLSAVTLSICHLDREQYMSRLFILLEGAMQLQL